MLTSLGDPVNPCKRKALDEIIERLEKCARIGDV